MDYEQFITLVQQMTKRDRGGTERAVQAVLTTLAEHLSKTEAADVMERLPPELQPYLYTDTGPRAFSAEEFVRRVAEREGSDPESAERDAAAVFAILPQAIGPDVFAHVQAQLPQDYGPLLSGRSVIDPLDRFLERVSRRAGGIGTDEARRVSEAVLETLAERVAPGDADDLAANLPLALHEALHRGKEHQNPRMTVQEFGLRVAERSGLPIERAARAIPAVFATLREDVGDEFFDVRVQLPEEYRHLLGTQRAY
ncbi:DUF2267 domain-containing protein [Pseudonocardia acidicola]|uniref:DUF2267 domain-containing protein n=1 Tax=Pseudonocardia acidicola TaxID=2724939 RepID=A0ABX1S952_9PSEU|nr:DUF2267 domain-containing protein [Pseudonocardia acidicola]NMH96993.1 DUF2267 domain-containing protein [Pseudonocardia acidicola]